jgi:16S rRNA (adenine1518-N6/adenine1519-N6)-dimethyltransferase
MKSKLGQHFLKSEFIIKKIVKLADIKKNDIVLEVGPGKGILTKELLKCAKKVIAVEKDEKLVEFLKTKFGDCGNLLLIQGDILKTRNGNPKLKILENLKEYKIVANIPYYITSRFLRNFLTAKNQPSKIVLMVQKELAERIRAAPPKMNLLAISVQVYGKPKIAFEVSKKYFSPQPKVNSAVIAIDNISREFFRKTKLSEKEFFNLAKIGFSHKRKLLMNNLEKIQFKKELKAVFGKCGIPLKTRAQELKLKDWTCLTLKLQKIKRPEA